MLQNDPLLEFDFQSPEKKKSFLSRGLLVRLSVSITILILFSLIFPTERDNQNYNNPYRAIDLQYNLMRRAYASAQMDQPYPIDHQIKNLVPVFYARRDFEPFWTATDTPLVRLGELVSLLDSSKYFGFPIDYFSTGSLKAQELDFEATQSMDARISLELAATFSALKLMLYLGNGIVERDTIPASTSDLYILTQTLGNTQAMASVKDVILGCQPKLYHYRSIASSLPNFINLIELVQSSGAEQLDTNLIARRLHSAGLTGSFKTGTKGVASGSLAHPQDTSNSPFEPAFNAQTQGELAQVLQYKYLKACLNLNRLRRINTNGDNYLFVNIPEYRLYVFESNGIRDVFNVIVGKYDTPTPVFSSYVERIVTNPHWTVPKSIVDSKLLHRIRNDSTYLARNRYVVIDGREEVVDPSIIDWNAIDPLEKRYFLRQLSSPFNAMGRVKIMFPNQHSVYIHDTPSRGLFSSEYRNFSFGCIRLQNPLKLAQYIADGYYPENGVDIISKLVGSPDSRELHLTGELQIHIQYITCMGSKDNELFFFTDIYGHDYRDVKELFPKGLPWVQGYSPTVIPPQPKPNHP